MPHTTKLKEENVFWTVISDHSWQGRHGRTAHIMVIRKEGETDRDGDRYTERNIQKETDRDRHTQ